MNYEYVDKLFGVESIKYKLVIHVYMPEYVDLKLPKELVDSIRKFINENPEYGYSSVPEFVKEAIRIRLRDLESKKVIELIEKKKIQPDIIYKTGEEVIR